MLAISLGVTLAMTIWNSHCVKVVIVQHWADKRDGKTSPHTFQLIGPSDIPKKNEKTYTQRTAVTPSTVSVLRGSLSAFEVIRQMQMASTYMLTAHTAEPTFSQNLLPLTRTKKNINAAAAISLTKPKRPVKKSMEFTDEKPADRNIEGA